MEQHSPHIVVLGAGFGGLTFCKAFRHPHARVTLVDRQNHHLFQPLLYQVATAGLSAPDIAEPVRSILSGYRHVTVLLDDVEEIAVAQRTVRCAHNTLAYDYLVVALGGVTSYFGRPDWERFAPGLKSLDDALRIRREVLLAFERAENETDPALQARLLTVAVVGGGPTGVELAGAFAELASHVLRRDFRRVDASQARVVLIEAGPRVLGYLPPALSASAERQLARHGVEVRTHARVRELGEGFIEFTDGQRLEAGNIIWAAGVAAHPLAAGLGAEQDRVGRVKVQPDLSLAGHPEVFVIGDMALVVGENGQPVPGVSPAAMQMARHVARLIGHELSGRPANPGTRPAFRYRDQGTMATIGRSAAVAKVGRLEFSGFAAWVAWLFVHLIFLIGFDNKLGVLLQWTYSYLTYRRGARIITGLEMARAAARTPRVGGGRVDKVGD